MTTSKPSQGKAPYASGIVSRRAVLAGGVGGAFAATLGAAHAADAAPEPSAQGAVTKPDWLDVLTRHRDTVSLRITTMSGLTVSHRAHEAQQSASSIKVFHLAAYAQAVARGTLQPQQRVPMRQWERWYYPADGGAHAKALARLRVPSQGNTTVSVAADPNSTVALDDVVSAMIQESDNAAADLVRELVGPDVVRGVADGFGATATVIPTMLGANLRATHGSLAGQETEHLAARYLSDESFAASMLDATTWTDYAGQAAVFATQAPRTSAADLARVYDRVASGTAPGVATMRRHLEWAKRDPAVRTGFKGGNVPGVLTAGIEQRAPGTQRHASAALLVGGLDERTASSIDPGWLKILIDAMNDPDYAQEVRDRLAAPAHSAAPVGPMVQTDFVR